MFETKSFPFVQHYFMKTYICHMSWNQYLSVHCKNSTLSWQKLNRLPVISVCDIDLIKIKFNWVSVICSYVCVSYWLDKDWISGLISVCASYLFGQDSISCLLFMYLSYCLDTGSLKVLAYYLSVYILYIICLYIIWQRWNQVSVTHFRNQYKMADLTDFQKKKISRVFTTFFGKLLILMTSYINLIIIQRSSYFCLFYFHNFK